MGFYPLGMRLSCGLDRAGLSPDHVLVGSDFPFPGLLAFWVESFFLGLGDLFSSRHLLLRLENEYLSVKLRPDFCFRCG